MKNSINIFSETGCIPHDVLWKYRQGKLTATEKHAAEVHLTDCELCSDALAGMVNMENDDMITELRKSVRKISAPKKVIRFYDYRILSAAAAVAVLIVFTYVLNSTDKQEKQQIAQLINPEADRNKQEVFIDIGMPPPPYQNRNFPESDVAPNVKEKAAVHTYKWTAADASAALSENYDTAIANEKAAAEPAVTTKEENVLTQNTYSIQSGNATSGQTVTLDDKYEAAPSTASERVKSIAKKTASQPESKAAYFFDLKVSRTPAMTETEKLDTINTGSTPSMYENKNAETVTMARSMPFVYSQTLMDALDYFHHQQYGEAAQMFNIILERLPKDVNAQFYKGVSEMELQNFSEASTLLNKAMRNSDKTFYEEAKFKLALCYVKLNKKDDAQKLFREIKSEGGFYSERASSELELLK